LFFSFAFSKFIPSISFFCFFKIYPVHLFFAVCSSFVILNLFQDLLLALWYVIPLKKLARLQFFSPLFVQVRDFVYFCGVDLCNDL
jgi:hypothetical protein